MTKLPEKLSADRELIKEVAMDIGKEVVAYIERMYPAAIEATSSTFKLSVRNCICNEIMAALDTNDADAIRARLAERKRFRTRLNRMWKTNQTGSKEELERMLEQMIGEREAGID